MIFAITQWTDDQSDWVCRFDIFNLPFNMSAIGGDPRPLPGFFRRKVSSMKLHIMFY